MSEWISVEERLPEPWEHVDVWFKFGGESKRIPDVTFDGEEFVMATGCRCVTHWQPLPPPPRGDENE